MSINELNRIYINDALKSKQLCEIVLPQLTNDDNTPLQIAFIDNARSIIIGGNYKNKKNVYFIIDFILFQFLKMNYHLYVFIVFH